MSDTMAALIIVGLALGAGWRATSGWWLARIPVAVLLGHAAVGLGAYAGAFVGYSVIGAAGGLGLLTIFGHRRRIDVPHPEDPFVRAALITVALFGLALLALAFLRRPEGWDTIAIWLTKARAIGAEGSYDHAVFRAGMYYDYSHPDYPTFFPALQSLVFSLASGPYGTGLVVLLVSLNVAGLLTALAAATRGATLGVAAVVAFVVSPAVIERVAVGYADLPAALLVLSGVLLLRRREQPAWAACLLMAAAALTRSETIVHVGLVVALTAAFSAGLRRRAFTTAIAVVAAALPWWVLTASRGLENDTLSVSALRPDRMLSVVPARAGDAVTAVAGQMFRTDEWGIAVLVCVALLVTHRADRGLVLAALGGFATLVAIYMLTEVDHAWQIRATVDRITLTPTALFVVAAARAADTGTRPWVQRLARIGCTAVLRRRTQRQGAACDP